MRNDDEMTVVSAALKNAPIDVVSLIKELGINYVETKMEYGADGRIDVDDDCYTITVNSDQSRQRRKFTAAHELAHYLLHRDLLQAEGHLDRLFDNRGKENPNAPFSPRHEVEANKFAAQILMPRAAIRDRMVWEDYDLQKLAEAFGVSAKAMEIRLNVLGINLEAEKAKEAITANANPDDLPF
jgi:Zn-dependent peptidase ImmA (M78 family)